MEVNHGENDTERGGQSNAPEDNEKGQSDQDRKVEEKALENHRWLQNNLGSVYWFE